MILSNPYLVEACRIMFVNQLDSFERMIETVEDWYLELLGPTFPEALELYKTALDRYSALAKVYAPNFVTDHLDEFNKEFDMLCKQSLRLKLTITAVEARDRPASDPDPETGRRMYINFS